MALVLPRKKIEPTEINPSVTVIFGSPKCGKSSILAQLENNLIIDTENGTKYLSALKVDGSSFDNLKEIKNELQKDNPYTYLTIDTITVLEEMLIPAAAYTYKKLDIAKHFDPKTDDLLALPKGLGYYFLRKVLFKVLKEFQALTDHLILVAHVKESYYADPKTKSEATHLDLDLTGKIKGMVSGAADVIGYIDREENDAYISFLPPMGILSGSRIDRLNGERFLISEKDEKTGKLVTHWDKIFLPQS